jgi:hypothetical protein
MQNDAFRISKEAKVCRTYLCESVIKSAGPMLFIVVKVVIGFSTASGEELGGLGALDRQSLERLRLGLVAALGPERGAEALSEALVWAVENPARLDAMRNPPGYLFRVGRTRTRPRLRPRLAAVPLVDSPIFEAGGSGRPTRSAVPWEIHLPSEAEWPPDVPALLGVPISVGGQGRDRTADLPLFRRSLVPAELPGQALNASEHIGRARPARPRLAG